MKKIGTREEVMNKIAKKTSGGLLKKDLKINKQGKIVSKRVSKNTIIKNKIKKVKGNTKLKTGWKQWDKYLNRFVGKRINIMEIGVFKGDATSWFLKNIMTNPQSLIYAVDTFEGSPEYKGVNFKSIEKTFYDNIKKTDRENQVVVMKMYSFQALNKIIQEYGNNLMFDIIFIDASHEAQDVISDAILSWNLLNDGGVMIFDDYEWDKMVQQHFRPKIAIDSFIKIMKPTLKILYTGYQMIVQKKSLDIKNSPIVPIKIKDEVNTLYNNILNEQIIFDVPTHNNKLDFELRIGKIKNYTDGIFDLNNYCKYYKQYIKDKGELYYNNSIYLKYSPWLLVSYHAAKLKNNSNKSYKTIFEKYKKYILNNKKLKGTTLVKIMNYFNINFYHSCYQESIMRKKSTKKINFLNSRYAYDFIGNHFEKKEIDNLLSIYKKYSADNFTYYDISCTSNVGNKNLFLKKPLKYKNCIHNRLNLKNLDNMIEIANNLHKKIDILNFSYGWSSANIHLIKSRAYSVSLFYSFVFGLIVQKKGGNATYWSNNLYSDIKLELLYFISKYYKKVQIKLNLCSNNTRFIIYCENFKGITKEKIKKLHSICYDIDKQIPNAGIDSNILNKKLRKKLMIKRPINKDSTNLYLHNLLSNSINFDFRDNIIDFNTQKEKYFNNEIKLYKRIKTINDETDENNKTKQLNIQLKNQIFVKQIQYVFKWIEKVFGVKGIY